MSINAVTVTTGNKDVIEANVRRLILEGWTPHGNPELVQDGNNIFIQVMKKGNVDVQVSVKDISDASEPVSNMLKAQTTEQIMEAFGATPVGQSLLYAATPDEALTAIGGIGSIPPAAPTTVGGVKEMANIIAPATIAEDADLPVAVTAINGLTNKLTDLLNALIASGNMSKA